MKRNNSTVWMQLLKLIYSKLIGKKHNKKCIETQENINMTSLCPHTI